MLLRARSNKKFWTPSLIVPGKGAAGLGLQTNLGGFWPLDTTSWLDATGNGTTLSQAGTNAVVAHSGGGPGGKNYAAFDGTNWLTSGSGNSHIDSGGGSVSVSFWSFMMNQIHDNIVHKGTWTFGGDEWLFIHDFVPPNEFAITIIDSQTGSSHVLDSGVAFDFNTGTWIHQVMTWNASTNLLSMYVNGNAGTSATVGGGATIVSGGQLTIYEETSSSAIPVTGGVALVGVWKGRVLTATDVSNLYNSGSGLTYAQML